MNDNGDTFLALIAGTAIGAALGVLYAPDKGSVTRQKIAEQAETTRDSLAESALDLRDQAAHTLASHRETLDEKLSRIASDVSYKTEDVITSLEKQLAELKKKNKKLQKS